ncbi:MAG: ATP-grasp domain-containing protein, partial [Gammaproteobacteria bacterium]|nr:ATP-grasp domain-containing protein [Gammaproteobacteria bacterium]NIR98955.1 ATP-grasp domain-containing protein [Gammaproteobacteria bacterium]NIT62236.1 ATP-grasp domain-containing protein [Gammaproteobacteria bacterium]NIV19065.1 ATP-grasp domain-containing protein [Gammaproteobacteria bacterium]NIY30816.1 ATP-grasp domain-containing protein [Gammaproteobacteria bacterium]
MTKKHVFVFGLNEFNRNKLKTIRHADRYEFHSLLDIDEIKDARQYAFQELLDKAEHTLRVFGGPVDAIVNFWDFPASVIQPILCRRRGLPAPSLQSVVRTTNKYWSRIEQQKVIPGHVPRFALFHPWDEKALSKIDLAYPFWIKPVQSYSGYLGFRVNSAQNFQRHVRVIRDNIARYAEPFAELLRYLELPAELGFLDGSYCIAEEIISGKQCTVEGFVHGGEVQTYGIIDSYRFPNKVSFSRYEYPSRLHRSVQRRIEEISIAVMGHMGFDQSAFNIEYFYDRRRDRLQLLE